MTAHSTQARASLLICPIYASLPSEQQAKIFEPTPKDARICHRLQILLRLPYDRRDLLCYRYGFLQAEDLQSPLRVLNRLIVTPISQAQAAQRAGRAGRTQPGPAFGCTKWSLRELEENTIPEIQRTNMNSVVLMLKSLGIHHLLFDFMVWSLRPFDASLTAWRVVAFARHRRRRTITEHRAPRSRHCISRRTRRPPRCSSGPGATLRLGALNDRGELTKLGRTDGRVPVLTPSSRKPLYWETSTGVSLSALLWVPC